MGTCLGDTGETQQASVAIVTSCTLPSLPTGLVETTPLYKPSDNAHGWGFVTYPASTPIGSVLLLPAGAWGDACSSPGVASGGDAWPGSPAMVDTRRRLAGLGYVVYTVCHRPPTVAVWPAQVSDTICAHRALADLAAGSWCAGGHCGDGSTCASDAACSGHGVSGPLFLAGTSSGAHLALSDAWSILAAPAAFEDGTCPRSGARPTTAGVVPWSGIYDLPGFVWSNPSPNPITALLGFACSSNPFACAAASPISYAHPPDGGAQPPVMFGHGTLDTVMPYAQARSAAAYALDAGDAYTLDPQAEDGGAPIHAGALFDSRTPSLGCTVPGFLNSPQ